MKVNRRFNILVFLGICISCTHGPVTPSAYPQEDVISMTISTIENEILLLVNNHRISLGINPLNRLAIIKSQTKNHCLYMITRASANHDFFNERRLFLVANAGATNVADNVAYGGGNSEMVVNTWLSNDQDRTNIEGDFTSFNLTAQIDKFNGYYYTLIFINE